MEPFWALPFEYSWCRWCENWIHHFGEYMLHTGLCRNSTSVIIAKILIWDLILPVKRCNQVLGTSLIISRKSEWFKICASESACRWGKCWGRSIWSMFLFHLLREDNINSFLVLHTCWLSFYQLKLIIIRKQRANVLRHTLYSPCDH